MKKAASLAFLAALLWGAAPAGAAGDAPCLDCHDGAAIPEGSRSTHRPFGEGDCGACHLDHGDEERLVLAEEGNALCSGCHDAAGESFLDSHSRLRGDGASCLGCHDPHGSAQPRLLRKGRHRPLLYGRCDPCHRFDGRINQPAVRDLCLSCHEGGEFSRSYGHTPVVEGKCLDCHDPHGSRLPSLLLGRYDEGRWATGDDRDFALCLGCHDAAAFTAPGGEKTTSFRSGELNIHRVHVEGSRAEGRAAPDRGLSCRNCHEVHSSAYPRLIRESLDCGGVPCLKLQFRSLPEGGECSVSCHGTKSYSWDGTEAASPAPAAAPPPPPPAAAPQQAAAVTGPTELEKTINRRCRSCHEQRILAFSRSNVHPPVRQGNCSACHLDHGKENRLVLLDREDRLCGRCHELRNEAFVAAHRGYRLQKARCTECHDPHASGKPRLFYSREHEPFADRDCGACHDGPEKGWELDGRINEVCSRCHEEVLSREVLHSALPAKGCTGCHRPHASETGKFLRAEGSSLCFLCHSRAPFSRQNVHPPVADGECATCHPPHGSGEKGLFTASYPLAQYLPFDLGKYSLCWQCHESSLAGESAAEGTGFRNSSENLHARHVQNNRSVSDLGERVLPGLTCRNCHDPHSTDGPRLIRKSLDCDGVPCLQLEYHKVGEGGRCLAGCHVRQSYIP